jgi:hypothetical protein
MLQQGPEYNWTDTVCIAVIGTVNIVLSTIVIPVTGTANIVLSTKVADLYVASACVSYVSQWTNFSLLLLYYYYKNCFSNFCEREF